MRLGRIVLSGTAKSTLCIIALYCVDPSSKTLAAPQRTVSTGKPNDSFRQFHKVLSDAEKQHILDGQFTLVGSTQAMPEPLKNAFALITREQQFELANPGQKYQATDVIEVGHLPSRRMICAGANRDKWFIHYEHGGIGHSYAVVVFAKTTQGGWEFLWGGVAFERAKDLDDLRKKIADGRFHDDRLYYW